MIRVARGHVAFMVICGMLAGVATGIIMAKAPDGTIRLTACEDVPTGECYWQADGAKSGTASFVVIDGVTYSPSMFEEGSE